MHAVPVGSNPELEAAKNSGDPAPLASVLLQGAQAMLVRQQQQEEAAQTAAFAANAGLLEAQVSTQLHLMQPLTAVFHLVFCPTRGCVPVCLH